MSQARREFPLDKGRTTTSHQYANRTWNQCSYLVVEPSFSPHRVLCLLKLLHGYFLELDFLSDYLLENRNHLTGRKQCGCTENVLA